MTIDELLEGYVVTLKKLSEALAPARRRPERLNAYFDYLLLLHELYRSAHRERPKEHRDEYKQLATKMKDSVGQLLVPTAAALTRAVMKERQFLDLAVTRPLSSYDDEDFWNWVQERADRCVEEVLEADGIFERVEAAGECLDDILERGFEQIREGTGDDGGQDRVFRRGGS